MRLVEYGGAPLDKGLLPGSELLVQVEQEFQKARGRTLAGSKPPGAVFIVCVAMRAVETGGARTGLRDSVISGPLMIFTKRGLPASGVVAAKRASSLTGDRRRAGAIQLPMSSATPRELSVSKRPG